MWGAITHLKPSLRRCQPSPCVNIDSTLEMKARSKQYLTATGASSLSIRMRKITQMSRQKLSMKKNANMVLAKVKEGEMGAVLSAGTGVPCWLDSHALVRIKASIVEGSFTPILMKELWHARRSQCGKIRPSSAPISRFLLWKCSWRLTNTCLTQQWNRKQQRRSASKETYDLLVADESLNCRKRGSAWSDEWRCGCCRNRWFHGKRYSIHRRYNFGNHGLT